MNPPPLTTDEIITPWRHAKTPLTTPAWYAVCWIVHCGVPSVCQLVHHRVSCVGLDTTFLSNLREMATVWCCSLRNTLSWLIYAQRRTFVPSVMALTRMQPV